MENLNMDSSWLTMYGMETAIEGAIKIYAEMALIPESEVLFLLAIGDETVRKSILTLIESVA